MRGTPGLQKPLRYTPTFNTENTNPTFFSLNAYIMVRRGKFQTRVDINPQDYDLFGNKTFIKERM